MEKRLNYTQRTKSGEAADVVKGVAKRVIVVRSPDPKVFEEAIFIVREDYMNSAGISRTQLLSQAKQAAGRYVGSVKSKETGCNGACCRAVGASRQRSGRSSYVFYNVNKFPPSNMRSGNDFL